MTVDFLGRYDSPLGEMVLASDGEALVGLWFQGQKHFARGLAERREEGRTAVLDETAAWLDRYFAGERPGPLPALRPRGTAFQRRVWEALTAVPYGETTTYGRLARALGSSPRAVGAAVGRNPIAILIPCHRVLAADGALTGYAGGLERKRALLEWEAGEGRTDSHASAATHISE